MGSMTEGSRAVYVDYERHSSNGRISTVSILNASLRRNYPEHKLTTVSPYMCDLMGFAKAGHATAKVDSSQDSFLATRSYVTSGNRYSGKEGTLRDDVTFAKYDYIWRDQVFIVFVAECSATADSPQMNMFILHKPKPRTLMSPNSTTTDDLITAISKWSIDLHKEIYIYDNYWCKSPELWAAIQDSRWEDVILDKKTKEALISDVEGFFDSRQVYKRFGIQWKVGVMSFSSSD